MVNYQYGKIYKLVCNKTGKVYIGSTTYKYLSERLSGHRKNYKEYLYKGRRYITSFDILENEDYRIELIELFPCNSKDELRAREQIYIDTVECINKYNAFTSPEEAKLKAVEYKKKLYEENKEEIYSKIKQYRESNKEHVKQVRKDYREKNLEHIRQQERESYQRNKEKRLKYESEQNKMRVNCEICGKDLCKGYVRKHIRLYHQEN